MAVDVAAIISLLAQRIVAAPPQVEAPRPSGRSVVLRRFREGTIQEAQARQELQTQGYLGPDVDRAISEGRLEREFDDFQDRLNALEEAFDKDRLTFAEFKVQVQRLIPDAAKAALVVDLADLKKLPKPKPLTPEEPPTLSVGQLLSSFVAGILPEPALRAELAARKYAAADVDLLVAKERARLPKPKAPERKVATVGDLRAMLDLGLISPQVFRSELIERRYESEDADRMTALELARIRERIPPPKPEELKELPLGDLKAMFTLGILTEAEFRAELRERKFSPEDVEREVALVLVRLLPPAPAP